MAVIRDLQDLSVAVDTASNGYFNKYDFGNLGRINASHGTDYPLLHLLPPSSNFTNPYKNDETLTCTFHCYMTTFIHQEADGTPIGTGVNSQGAQLEKTYDYLLEQFKGTMQTLSFNEEHKYILTGNWNIERVNEEFNDGLVGIIVTVQINKFTHCLLYGQ